MLSADSGADICSSESSLRRCSNTAGSFDCVCPANTRLNEDFNYCLVTSKFSMLKQLWYNYIITKHIHCCQSAYEYMYVHQ